MVHTIDILKINLIAKALTILIYLNTLEEMHLA